MDLNVQEKRNSGESLGSLMRYWWPELSSMGLLIALPIILDSFLVATLKSTSIYGALGAATRVIHFVLKFAEAIPVAAIALIGRHNGAGEYSLCGKRLGDALWATGLIGLVQFCLFFFGAEQIYRLLHVPEHMIPLGLTYLRVQAFTIPLMFVFHAFMGFFRGIKNTQTPLWINCFGVAVFAALDAVLILGKFGIPAYGLTGSAIATLVRYGLMNVVTIAIVVGSSKYAQYLEGFSLLHFDPREVFRLLKLSIPIVIDKSVLALAIVWLGKLFAFGGQNTLASIELIRNVERFALLPALAFAQVITFLVSNNLGQNNPLAARHNLKKVLLLSLVFTVALTSIVVYNLHFFTEHLDPTHALDGFVKPVAAFLALFLCFDLTQIVLAAALRGAGDLHTVMITRIVACLGFFLVSELIIEKIVFKHAAVKFMTIYTFYYLMTACMAVAFFMRVRGQKWLEQRL